MLEFSIKAVTNAVRTNLRKICVNGRYSSTAGRISERFVKKGQYSSADGTVSRTKNLLWCLQKVESAVRSYIQNLRTLFKKRHQPSMVYAGQLKESHKTITRHQNTRSRWPSRSLSPSHVPIRSPPLPTTGYGSGCGWSGSNERGS
ncbi:hypothetical protein T11_7661 [Trichinella zimbabwensis]|uniref:Uncharacterized protein n=1 Tax=Trichinella zimbabwensis TaxID=268475 RepID=A0A0V1I368_9BILA|nr:hypothetical protein T11_7661 [Trichinella zimbabwensis]